MTSIIERCNHNRFAEQFASRLCASASSISVPLTTDAPAASVASQNGATSMSSPSIFSPASSSSAFLKMGVMGKQGAGKSKTAAKVTIGLIKHLRELGVDYANKPVAFFDTETGSDWLIPDFKKDGIDLVVAKKRAFADLLQAVRWAEENASALVIDSITHPWRELQESYMRKKQRSFLQIDDWGYLKGDHGWAQFTDLYINSKLHIIMCGRAGDDTEQYTDENGKRQFEKVGVKMKTEGETGFEPSLLVLMEREMDLRTNAVTHRAYVLKDRSTLLDGAEIDNPGFKDFLPHIGQLNLGGAHVGVQVTGDSQHILRVEKKDWTPVQREICIDEIQTLMSLHFPSQSAEDKKNKLKALLAHFDATWTEIEKVMPLPDLRAGYDRLHIALEGRPSKYGSAIAKDSQSLDINDSLPDFATREVKPSAELLASRIVVEATKASAPVDTTSVSPNGIPAFLDRTAKPAPSAFDESKWLADLTTAFSDCMDFVSFGQQQMKIMTPARQQVTEDTWKKAMKLASRCIARITKAQTSGTFEVAAE